MQINKKGVKMVQLTKKYPHSPSQVLSFSENHKKHTLLLRTQSNNKSAVFMAKLNKSELKQLCNYLESEFPIHREDY